MDQIPRVLGIAATILGYSTAAQTALITVTTTGAPVTGKCSLTQAIQAASTNHSVGGCAAGSASATDTIQLQNQTYQSYGKALLVPVEGGPLVISGTTPQSNGSPVTTIIGANYGFPSPNPINAYVCASPASLYTGGNLTLRNVALISDGGTGHGGICQYSGRLNLDNDDIGEFQQGGLMSAPNVNDPRTLILTTTDVFQNINSVAGAGLALYGQMTVTINSSWITHNYSTEGGGGIAWNASGSMTITNTEILSNLAIGSIGGGLYLTPLDASASVTVDGGTLQNNGADQEGGAMYIQLFGSGKLIMKGVYIPNSNWSHVSPSEGTLNSGNGQAYKAIRCNKSSSIYAVNIPPWTSHAPPLVGDGTCSFP